MTEAYPVNARCGFQWLVDDSSAGRRGTAEVWVIGGTAWVTLTGSLRPAAAQQLVTLLVAETPGIAEVVVNIDNLSRRDPVTSGGLRWLSDELYYRGIPLSVIDSDG